MPAAVFFLLALTLIESFGWILRPEIPEKLQSSVGERTTYRARVVEPPEPQARGARAVVQLEEVAGEGHGREGGGREAIGGDGVKVLLTMPFLPDWERGDEISFQARLKSPTRYKNPGGFDYRRHLWRRGIALTGFLADEGRAALLERAAEGEPSGRWTPWAAVGRQIDRWRRSIAGQIFERIDGPPAGFLAALLVGDRSGISDDLWQRFRVTGTAHLIAISGQHIALVGVFFYVIFLWILKRSVRLMLLFSVRRIASLLMLVPVWLYTFIAGASPSVLRAAVMASLVPAALFSRREVDPPSALAAAAILLALLDPSAPFSASYQLSFLAVLGILLFRPEACFGAGPIDRVPYRLRKYLLLPFFMTLGASLLTAPLVAYRFNLFSLSGLWNNFWAIPACGVLLIATPFLLVFHLDAPVEWMTGLFLKGIEVASRHPFSFSVYPTGWELILAYGLVGLAAIAFHRKVRLRYVVVLAVIGLIGFLPFGNWLRSVLPTRLEVTFLDVGQGDAALVVAPSGRTMLIDGGGFLIPGQGPPVFDLGERVLIPYLGRRGIDRIDRILLSHAHPDHYGGLDAVLSQLRVGEFWWNGQRFPDETFDRLLEKMGSVKTAQDGTEEGDGQRMRIVRGGRSLEWEGMRFEILYPESVMAARGMNDNSLVVRLTYRDVSFLFTGDIERWGEKALASLPQDLRTTVVKVPHHASRTSSSIPFIDKVQPRFAVASFGESNPFDFPHPDILERYERRGARVFRTDRDGAVTFRTDGHEVTVKKYAQGSLFSATFPW